MKTINASEIKSGMRIKIRSFLGPSHKNNIPYDSDVILEVGRYVRISNDCVTFETSNTVELLSISASQYVIAIE